MKLMESGLHRALAGARNDGTTLDCVESKQMLTLVIPDGFLFDA
jgi:hypothetical protein